MKRLLSVACCVAVGLAFVSCKDSQACEQARLKMAKTWGKVKDTAGARALPGEDDELTDAQKAERKRVWTAIQGHAYLVEGSFKTPQITWPAADKGRTDLQAAYQNVPNKEDPMVAGFGQMFVEANAEYEAFKKDCK
jgi:hypothetical protein